MLALFAGAWFGQAAPSGSWVAGQPPDWAGWVGAGSVEAGGDWYRAGASVGEHLVQVGFPVGAVEPEQHGVGRSTVTGAV